MGYSKAKENPFQQNIIRALAAQGWLVGEAKHYNRANALYEEDVVGYFKEAYPERWQRLQQGQPNPEAYLIQQTARELEKKGTLDVLRYGFRVPGVQIDLCGFKPDHTMNPDTLRRHELNRLRVVEEVSYSPHTREGQYNPRLDLVLFVNGIPVATLELKSDFKQSLEDAKRQYKFDRPVRDKLTRKKEPLLTFKRGALVHFAVTQTEVAMTTKLNGKDTFFLPFNQGTKEGGAGNPQPEDPNQYPTAYLWEDVLQPDNWLKILGRFLHLEKKEEEDFHGRKTTKEIMIFPRYHQWDVVNQLINTTREEGPGQRYLVQHSAGSGKSNSIAWTAYQLSQLYKEGERLFSSIIVVTDRTVLDKQLQETIYQFDHAEGVVEPITGDGHASKSEHLAAALHHKKRIIIVTIQTFPALFEVLAQHPQLAEGNYAVIADEAHSSQTGTSANKLRTILGGKTEVYEEGEEVGTDEMLAAAVEARKANENISFYAFTATPKSKTLELFGRRPHPDLPASADNKPESFHLYSMRQAIEEGFILDVLKRYTTYSLAYKLAHADGEQEVDSKQARKTIAKWVRLHPHNINQKVQIIVEHFRANVRHLLDGQAKAMVVTSSRQEAVRYQLAMLEYIKTQNYKDVVPLVAFSGSVMPDDVIPMEVTEYSDSLNPGLLGRDHAEALDSDSFNVMIVANKYQTGFDQPKLCAMYVDKKLADVACVQTLSRLNRLFPGKETFILDFVNDTEDILEAFKPYYERSELSDVTDPQLIYDLKDSLDNERIYRWEEVNNLVEAFFDKKASEAQLTYACSFGRDRFKKRYEEQLSRKEKQLAVYNDAKQAGAHVAMDNAEAELKDIELELDKLRIFRKNLRNFINLYEFISQIVFYEDTELEQLCIYAKHLAPLLRESALSQDKINLDELELTHYRLTKRAEQKLQLEEGRELDPHTGVGTATAKDPKQEKLKEIIEALNEVYGTGIEDDDQLRFVNGISERLARDEEVVEQIKHNTPEQVMHGIFPQRLQQALLHSMTDHEEMTLATMSSEANLNQIGWIVLKTLVEQIRPSV